MANELKPCPFCGEDAEHIHIFAGEEIVSCVNEDCIARPVVHGQTKSQAVAAWNTRAASPVTEARHEMSEDQRAVIEYFTLNPSMAVIALDAMRNRTAPVTEAPGELNRGLELAARWVEKRRESFDNEYGHYDPETGATEYGTGPRGQAMEEYSGELAEIADGIRALKAAAPALSGAVAATPPDIAQAVIEAAVEWWSEREINDWAEADLARAVAVQGGDWTGCPDCDFECGEPCTPATVAEMLVAIDHRVADLVSAGRLCAHDGYQPPANWKRSAAREEALKPKIRYVPVAAQPQGDDARLDFLAAESGLNLVTDDDGRWAVSDSGMQPVPPEGGFTEMVGITCLVEPDCWKPTVREAIDHYRAAMSPATGAKGGDDA